MSRRNKYNLLRILPFGLIWLVLGWVFLFTEFVATDQFSFKPDGAIDPNNHLFLFVSLAITAVGMIIGVLEIYVFNKLFFNKRFATKLFYKTLTYGAFLFAVMFAFYSIALKIESGVVFLSDEMWIRFGEFINSLTFASTSLQIGVSLFLSLFYFEISENIGCCVNSIANYS